MLLRSLCRPLAPLSRRLQGGPRRAVSGSARSGAAGAEGAAPAEATLIDGNAVAKQVREEVKAEVDRMREERGQVPGLAFLLIGSRKDSATYVRKKKKACEAVGMTQQGAVYDDDVSEDELLRKIDEFNADPAVHGILVQLPLPPHIDEDVVLTRILPEKDADGLHPLNVAALANTKTHTPAGRRPWEDPAQVGFNIPCTPQGCVELLDRMGVSIQGKRAVVLGRSNMVGIPVALLLMQRHATVTVVHSRTENPGDVVREADIVVAAVGRPLMVQGDWIKPGAVVIDVGINALDDPSKKRGYRLVGDVDFDAAKHKASAITPVPGGVGPMTIAMLLRNTLMSAKRALQKSDG